MLRTVGGSAVGMSTAPEVVAAAHAGMPALGLSLITNRCLGPGDDSLPLPTHEEVLEATAAAAT
jgi:purine-nucleoside phosphorylase